MRRFLLNLKNLGFQPKVVVIDGSTLYPKMFVFHMHHLFDPTRSFCYAANQWASLVTTPEYLTDPDLARALAMLTAEKFEKMTPTSTVSWANTSEPTSLSSEPIAGCVIWKKCVTNGAADERLYAL